MALSRVGGRRQALEARGKEARLAFTGGPWSARRLEGKLTLTEQPELGAGEEASRGGVEGGDGRKTQRTSPCCLRWGLRVAPGGRSEKHVLRGGDDGARCEAGARW